MWSISSVMCVCHVLGQWKKFGLDGRWVARPREWRRRGQRGRIHKPPAPPSPFPPQTGVLPHRGLYSPLQSTNWPVQGNSRQIVLAVQDNKDGSWGADNEEEQELAVSDGGEVHENGIGLFDFDRGVTVSVAITIGRFPSALSEFSVVNPKAN